MGRKASKPKPLPKINIRSLTSSVSKYIPKNVTKYIPKNVSKYIPKNVSKYIPNLKTQISRLKTDVNNKKKEINNKGIDISRLTNNLNIRKAAITRLRYKISDISNANKFLKEQMYGSEKQPGYLNLLVKKEKFSNINNIEEMNTLEGFTVSEIELTNVINENKLLENQIQKNQNNYTTDDTQVFYKKQQYYRQQDINYILFIIFYSLILALAVYLFIFDNTINVYLKVFITILLAIYPFIIERIEFFVYFIFYYVYALINGVPINMGNYYGFTFKNK
jgi:hypothetical protein